LLTAQPTQRWNRPAIRAGYEPVGRAGAIALAVVPAVVLTGDGTTLHRASTAAVLTVVWFVGLNAGFAASRTTLAALGPRVAVARGVLLGLVLAAAASYVVPSIRVGVGMTFAIAVLVLALVACWELLAQRVRPAIDILLVGPGEASLDLMRELQRTNDARFALIGVVDDDARPSAFGALVLGTTSELPRILERTRPDIVALVPGCNRPETFAQLLDSAAAGFRVVELAQLYEHAFGRVPVRDLTRAWFMSVLHLYQRPYSKLAKRTTDIIGALLLLLLVAPLFPILALAVRGTGRGILLSQRRVGEHGEIFTMYKFRTMRTDAELRGEAVWAAKDDPRITGAGKVMRRLRLDELPQIWNIFRGDMSLVGPRPERPEFIDELLEAVPFWDRRHLVKPGITGWAQVNHGYTADSEGSLDKLSYDLWYIRHRSLTVDLVICVRTLSAVLRGEWRRRGSAPEELTMADLDSMSDLLRFTGSPRPLETET
jgi:exopolysaccharide biosynthesis polyprenyl glycosylphosphotransferase